MTATCRKDHNDPLTIQADWLVTMAGPPIRTGRLAVQAGRIAAVGPADEVPIVGRLLHLRDAVLMPGAINAHCHLELSAYHGALPAGDFWQWISRLIELRREPNAARRESQAAEAAVQSMLQAGTTCVGDVFRAAWMPQRLAGLPIRKVCYLELISGASSPPRDPGELEAALTTLAREDPLAQPALSAHAPYTVRPDHLRACIEIARKHQLPIAMHLAETPEEIEWLSTGEGRIQEWQSALWEDPPASPCCGPAKYAIRGALASHAPAALVHMNYAEDWRLLCELLPERRPTIVYCPRSHEFFGHTPHPFREMLAARLRVAIGTDSAASHAPDESAPLSVMDELRWLHQKCPDIPPKTLFSMATLHAAKALGLDGQIGRLKAGYRADLAAYPLLNSAATDPLTDVLERAQPPILVCVEGRVVA